MVLTDPKQRLRIGMMAALLALASSPAGAGSLHTDGRYFKDAQGRVVILRGVNIAGNAKVPPFRGITDLAQLDPLPGWGVNVIRLVFTWEAYEPQPGEYDQAYLDYLTGVADGAWERGIFVIIDFHQDGYSRYLSEGCGEGFPLWAVSPQATPDEPDNGPNCEQWLDQAANDPDMHLSFSEFFSDANGVRTRFLLLWERLAQSFAGHPAVIGYDIINEPWGSEALEMLPLYEDAAAVIRSQDPSAILFIEPHIVIGNGGQTGLPRPSFDNFAYAPHYYDPSVIFLQFWHGNTLRTDLAFWNMNSKATEWGVPFFVGEFGGPAPAFDIAGYVDLLYRRLNDYIASGAQWNYTPGWTPELLDGWNAEDLSIVDDQGSLRPNFEIRPYAQKVSGIPTGLEVSDDGLSTELTWLHDKQAGLTELFVPRFALFGLSPVKIEKEGTGLLCAFDSSQTRVNCASNFNGFKRVKVRPCIMVLGACL